MDGCLIIVVKLIFQVFWVFDLVQHIVDVLIKGVLGVDLLSDFTVLILEFLGIHNHFIDLLCSEFALLVGNGDAVFSILIASLVSCYGQNGVFVDFKDHIDLWKASCIRLDSFELKLAKLVVIFNKYSFPLVNVDF